MYQEVGVTRELVRVGLLYLQLSMSYVMNTDQGYVTPPQEYLQTAKYPTEGRGKFSHSLLSCAGGASGAERPVPVPVPFAFKELEVSGMATNRSMSIACCSCLDS
jgi:hypothetical protein